MNRRGFFKFLPALAALPAICKEMVKPKEYWAGTTIPRSNPWQELDESEKRAIMESGYHYSYHFVNNQGAVTTTPALPNTVTIYREAS